MPILWSADDDEDNNASAPQSNSKATPGASIGILIQLFSELTLRVTIPAVGLMALGIWYGSHHGHKQLYGIIGTLIGLAVAALLVWQKARRDG